MKSLRNLLRGGHSSETSKTVKEAKNHEKKSSENEVQEPSTTVAHPEEYSGPIPDMTFKRKAQQVGGKISDDSAYVNSEGRGDSSVSALSLEQSSFSNDTASLRTSSKKWNCYRSSFDTAKAASSFEKSAGGNGTSLPRSVEGGSSIVGSLSDGKDTPVLEPVTGPSSSPSLIESCHSRKSNEHRSSRESGRTESSGHSRRSSFALERASFESNRASLDKFRKHANRSSQPVVLGASKDPLTLCNTLQIPQNLWTRFLALAVVPVDTPLPMNMLKNLWTLASNDDAEANANLFEQLGVMRLALLADNTAWALVQPGHLKALHEVAAEKVREWHSHVLQAYTGGGVGLADVLDDGYIMQNVGHHLLSTRRLAELRQLLTRPAWLECKLHSYGVASVVADFRRYLMMESDEAIKLLLEAFQMSISACLSHPHASILHAQLAGRLMLTRKSSQVRLNGEKLKGSQARPGSQPCALRTRTPSLEQAGGLQRMTLRGHTGGVRKVLLTPGGADVITSSTDGTSRVWDMEIGDCVLLLEGHTASLTDMATPLNSSIVVTTSEDGSARVWDLEEGMCLQTLVGHSGAVNSVAVDQAGKFAVTGGADGTARVWDLSSGACVQLLLGHTSLGALHKVLLTSDGSRAITCSSDFTARAWEVFSGTCLHVFTGHTAWVVDAALTNDNSLLVTASHDGTARVWDMLSSRCVHVLGGHAGRINAVRVASDNQMAITISDDFTARVYHLQSGACRHTLEGHGGWVSDCAILADSRAAITTSGDDLAVVWDLVSGDCKNVLEGHSGEVLSVALSRRGRFAVTGSMDATARIWDLAAGSAHLQRTHSGRIHGLLATPDASSVISHGDDGCLVWDVEAGSCTSVLEGPAVRWAASVEEGQGLLCACGDRQTILWSLPSKTSTTALKGTKGSRVKSWAASQDGHVAVVVLFDSTVTVWDLKKEEPMAILQRWGQRDAALGHTGGVNAAYITRDGACVLTVSKDCTARLWDVALGASTHLLQGHTDGVTGAAFSADDKLAVTLAYDNTARLWDVASGAALGVMPHAAAVTRAAFSPDSRLLLTAGADHVGLLWNCQPGRKPHPQHVLKGHKEELTGVAFSADNCWAATCSRDNSLTLWDCKTGTVSGTFVADAGLTCCLFAGSTLFTGDDSGILHLLQLP